MSNPRTGTAPPEWARALRNGGRPDGFAEKDIMNQRNGDDWRRGARERSGQHGRTRSWSEHERGPREYGQERRWRGGEDRGRGAPERGQRTRADEWYGRFEDPWRAEHDSRRGEAYASGEQERYGRDEDPWHAERGRYGAQQAYGDRRWRDQHERGRGGQYGDADPYRGGGELWGASYGWPTEGAGLSERGPSGRMAASARANRGPKGYTRSDERIREDVCEHIMHRHDIDSSEVTVEVQSGAVTLQGTVPERWMKHAIEDLADRCLGVNEVDNRVRVQRQEHGAAGAGRETSQQGSTGEAPESAASRGAEGESRDERGLPGSRRH